MARLMFAFIAPTGAQISANVDGRVIVECLGTKVGDEVVSATGTVTAGGAGKNLISTIGPVIPFDDTVIFLGNVTISGASLPEQSIIIIVERPGA